MYTPGSRSLSLGACARLFVLGALGALGAGGCTLLASAQLSDKPEDLGGTGGQGGGGGEGGSSASSSGTSSASSASASSSGSSMCPTDRGDCDGSAANGCETNLTKDDDHCGACDHQCHGSEQCKNGACI